MTRRKVRVTVSMSSEEANILKQNAEALGIRLSEFLRHAGKGEIIWDNLSDDGDGWLYSRPMKVCENHRGLDARRGQQQKEG